MYKLLGSNWLLVLALVSCFVSTEARADWFSCNPTEVVTFSGSRIHVACSNSITLNGNVVRYIALAVTHAEADAFLRAGQAALLSGLYFFVDLPVAATTNVPSCRAVDCRTPANFGVRAR